MDEKRVERNESDLAPIYIQPSLMEREFHFSESGSGSEFDGGAEFPEGATESVVESCASSISEDSLRPSHMLSPGRTPVSSTTLHSLYTVQDCADFSTVKDRRRPHLLGRLKSHGSSKPAVQKIDFQFPAEEPEKRFIDAIGMILPGVSDRVQCLQSRTHLVSTFRLCEPIEYSTALADHGLTYADYNRLIELLFSFLYQTSPREIRRDSGIESLSSTTTSPVAIKPDQNEKTKKRSAAHDTFFDVSEHLRRDMKQADSLNQLLEEATISLQDRGVPVMICISSYSLFAPCRISEAHVQILHVTPQQLKQSRSVLRMSRNFSMRSWCIEQRLSFIDSLPLLQAEQPSSQPKCMAKVDNREVQGLSPTRRPLHRSQSRDQSKPYPLWPNAIPSRKRAAMHANLEKYGIDPYFRAWMRADINSRTESNSYQNFMIEKEADPFVNKRLTYIDTALRKSLFQDILTKGNAALREQFSGAVNRHRYEHNRRLECRRITENAGSRLRILRFAFRHPIYPPHTPEMANLGLSRALYQTILSDINAIHNTLQLSTKCPIVYLRQSFDKIRRRSAEHALPELSRYLRALNVRHRRLVWTVEKVPCVYDRGFAKDRTEWEISAWNCEDPLELLIQLETWGIVEKRLTLGTDV